MSNQLSTVSIALISVFMAGAASAAESTVSPGSIFEPKAVKAGVFEVMPWMGLAIGQNDNAGSSNTAKTKTTVTSVTPNVVIGLPTQGQMYALKYAGNYTQFASSTIDNFNDHDFEAYADNVWTTRLKSLINVNYIKGHDARNSIMFKSKELWHTSELKAMGHYGADGAIGQFELAAGQIAKRYDSNNNGVTQFYDYDRNDVKGTFFYRIAPASQMFIEAGSAKINYVVASANPLDSTEQSVMAGVKWEATAKTTGSAKIGTLKKSFSSALRSSGSSTVWDVDVTWQPKQYSKFNASLHQATREDGTLGGYIISQDSNFGWSHDWSGFVSSTLSLGDGVDKFQNGVRTDKRQNYALKGNYVLRSWLRAGLEYRYTKRNSTDALWSYTQGVTMLSLEGSL